MLRQNTNNEREISDGPGCSRHTQRECVATSDLTRPRIGPTSFPGSFILPPPGAKAFAPGGGKMKDPGNEVGIGPLSPL